MGVVVECWRDVVNRDPRLGGRRCELETKGSTAAAAARGFFSVGAGPSSGAGTKS